MKKILLPLLACLVFVGYTAVAIAPLDSPTLHTDTIYITKTVHETISTSDQDLAQGIGLIIRSLSGQYFELFLTILTAVGIPVLAAVQAMLKKNPHTQKLSGYLGKLADMLTFLVHDVQPKAPDAGPAPAGENDPQKKTL